MEIKIITSRDPGPKVKGRLHWRYTTSEAAFMGQDLVLDYEFANGHKRIITPESLTVRSNADNQATAVAHELGHILAWVARPKQARYNGHGKDTRKYRIQKVREEVMAWRMAKSICKPHLWREDFARYCLRTYVEQGYEIENGDIHFKSRPEYIVDFDRLPIISWGQKYDRKNRDMKQKEFPFLGKIKKLSRAQRVLATILED